MSELDRLADQHFLESQAHLRHIDDLMAKVKQAQAQRPVAPEHARTLARLEQEHGRMTRDLKSFRDLPQPATANTVARGEGIKGVLQTLGLELEKTLAAVIGGDTH